MEESDYVPLFETKPVRGRLLYRLYTCSIFLAICSIFFYRVSYFPADGGARRIAWIGLFLSEIWFTCYWFITVIVRWNPVHRYTFKDRLSCRCEKFLPGVDVFVCTADPTIEPPVMVMNTVLSIMAYDYPAEKLSVYLSDDGGSYLTFYALLEASRFAKHWLPFCRKFGVEPRSPEAYFQTAIGPVEDNEWCSIKRLYEEMKERIETATKLGRIPEEIRKQHKGFREWDFVSSRHDHQTILQILVDERDSEAVDVEGQGLPTLVYLAREKRPDYHHNFKAGAMNALIVRDALCFFMDEEKGNEIGFVQYPQTFYNLTDNDIYGVSLSVETLVEFPGIDANGGPCYIGTGCFHRREALCGKKYSKDYKVDWKRTNLTKNENYRTSFSEETCKVLASCTYEHNTNWGKEMGLKYGCPVEDIITGLSLQCRGWRSAYSIPKRAGFLGVAPTTLLQFLVQHKRWSEGDLQIFLSRYCPFIYGHKKIPLKLQISYCIYLLWAANSLPTFFYVTVPSLSLLRGISLFPEISNPLVIPFAYAFFANRAYRLGEFIHCGRTIRSWWNDQRMWLFKRTTAYLFAFCSNILRILGFGKSAFEITAKVADEDVSKRYMQEVMEFGSCSVMFDVLAAIAMLNMLSFSIGASRVITEVVDRSQKEVTVEMFPLQILLSGILVAVNFPVYQALFLRKDNGRLPISATYHSIFFVLLVCITFMY
ncbi:cellulose synthase-like protein E6 isoform X2 [Carica papaya]|uniref:cellulose synthase-like protein E6 isoform X2 n=1 Tax=Carica papaya TaxID=3649 RepID=UPI000B8CFD27|nr:cellulose synthase-like protein E6 isoform X2 [Carica papaya]